MKQNIADINARPVIFHQRSVTIEGVCRTACAKPYPHFTVEDRTATLICVTDDELPGIGEHVEVAGQFIVDIPAGGSFIVPRLQEARRESIGQHVDCSYVGCRFEVVKQPVAA